MKLLLNLFALIILVSCSNMVTRPNLSLEIPDATLELNEQGIPVECYDANGNFDSNRGHDYLDCDNLDSRVKF